MTDTLSALALNQAALFTERTPGSARLYERARTVLPMGVASSFQASTPYPIYLSSGAGSRVTDVDGNSYIDYHNGFGTMIAGHAHPAITAAIEKAARTGAHFASPTESVIELAEEVTSRFRLDAVRFCNSGTEATMDAIRLARAASGKSLLVKIEGAYHGHHDAVMFSVRSTLDAAEDPAAAFSVPSSRGIPTEIAALTKTIPFNDIAALEAIFDAFPDEIGVVIVEPVMMNVGIVLPQPGYLQAVRDLCTRSAAVLIFDEVKTGATIAPGGATEYFGVQPDLVTLAKAIGGGTPIGAFGGSDAVMGELERGVAGQGTFNGNPVSVAAALATLKEVLTADAYVHLAGLGTRLAAGCTKVLDQAGIPAHTTDLGAKGSITFRAAPLERYADYREVDDSLFQAYWLWAVNHGVFATPGKEEQWTISVQHSESDIDTTIDVLAGYCEAVTG